MKIALCVDTLSNGGAQRVAALWVNGFKQRGHEVSVIISNSRVKTTYPIPSDVPIYSVDFKINNGYIRHFIKKLFLTKKLRKYFKTIQPDLVIAVIPSWGPLIYKAKGNLTFKVVGTDHNSYEWPEYYPMPKRMEWLKYEFNKKFDAVTVLTQTDKDFIGNRLKNVFVLPNPLAFEPIKEIPKKEKIILATGRLDSWFGKGFDVLIKAWAKIASKHDGWCLQIAGGSKGKGLKYLKDLCQKLNITEKVDFLGFQPDIQSIYKDASIFVLSSRWEGFGLVLVEAMSQGCACLSCDYKGRQKEIITDNKDGLLCKTDDIEGLASCLDKLITDEKLRHMIQEQALKRSKDYQLNKIMELWENILESIGLAI